MIVIRTICATKIPALFFYKDNALYTDSGACSSLEMVTCSPFYKDTSKIHATVSTRTHAIHSVRYTLFYNATCNSSNTDKCNQFYKDTSNLLYKDTCSPFYKDTSRIVVVSLRTHAISSIRYNLFYKAACNSFSTYACSQLCKDTSKIHVVVSIRTRTISSIRYTLFYKAMQSVQYDIGSLINTDTGSLLSNYVHVYRGLNWSLRTT